MTRTALPGIALAAVAGALCLMLATVLPGVSGLMIAIVAGIALRNLRLIPSWARPGLAWSSKRMLRLGIVLLGLQLSIPSLAALGVGPVLVLVATVAATFLGTLLVARLIRAPRVTGLLIATGFAICGASAVAAMASVVDPDNESEDEVAQAIALVTLYGTVALFLIPALQPVVRLDDEQMGLWIGASIHEVAQVVAAGSAVSAIGLSLATVAKLGRVVLLAPLVATVGIAESRRARDGERAARPPLVPLFVIGFVLTAALRALVPLDPVVLDVSALISTLLLCVAMFCLGAGVDLAALVRTGGKAVVLGAASTAIAAGASLLGIALIG